MPNSHNSVFKRLLKNSPRNSGSNSSRSSKSFEYIGIDNESIINITKALNGDMQSVVTEYIRVSKIVDFISTKQNEAATNPQLEAKRIEQDINTNKAILQQLEKRAEEIGFKIISWQDSDNNNQYFISAKQIVGGEGVVEFGYKIDPTGKIEEEEIVVKFLNKNEDYLNKVTRENNISRLLNPNTSKLISKSDGTLGYTMKKLDGIDFMSSWDSPSNAKQSAFDDSNFEKLALSHLQRCQVIRDVLDQLNKMHRAGYYHGDINPTNIRISIDGDGNAHGKLFDFGQAAYLDQQSFNRLDPAQGMLLFVTPESGDKNGYDITVRTSNFPVDKSQLEKEAKLNKTPILLKTTGSKEESYEVYTYNEKNGWNWQPVASDFLKNWDNRTIPHFEILSILKAKLANYHTFENQRKYYLNTDVHSMAGVVGMLLTENPNDFIHDRFRKREELSKGKNNDFKAYEIRKVDYNYEKIADPELQNLLRGMAKENIDNRTSAKEAFRLIDHYIKHKLTENYTDKLIEDFSNKFEHIIDLNKIIPAISQDITVESIEMAIHEMKKIPSNNLMESQHLETYKNVLSDIYMAIETSNIPIKEKKSLLEKINIEEILIENRDSLSQACNIIFDILKKASHDQQAQTLLLSSISLLNEQISRLLQHGSTKKTETDTIQYFYEELFKKVYEQNPSLRPSKESALFIQSFHYKTNQIYNDMTINESDVNENKLTSLASINTVLNYFIPCLLGQVEENLDLEIDKIPNNNTLPTLIHQSIIKIPFQGTATADQLTALNALRLSMNANDLGNVLDEYRFQFSLPNSLTKADLQTMAFGNETVLQEFAANRLQSNITFWIKQIPNDGTATPLQLSKLQALVDATPDTLGDAIRNLGHHPMLPFQEMVSGNESVIKNLASTRLDSNIIAQNSEKIEERPILDFLVVKNNFENKSFYPSQIEFKKLDIPPLPKKSQKLVKDVNYQIIMKRIDDYSNYIQSMANEKGADISDSLTAQLNNISILVNNWKMTLKPSDPIYAWADKLLTNVHTQTDNVRSTGLIKKVANLKDLTSRENTTMLEKNESGVIVEPTFPTSTRPR